MHLLFCAAGFRIELDLILLLIIFINLPNFHILGQCLEQRCSTYPSITSQVCSGPCGQVITNEYATFGLLTQVSEKIMFKISMLATYNTYLRKTRDVSQDNSNCIRLYLFLFQTVDSWRFHTHKNYPQAEKSRLKHSGCYMCFPQSEPHLITGAEILLITT